MSPQSAASFYHIVHTVFFATFFSVAPWNGTEWISDIVQGVAVRTSSTVDGEDENGVEMRKGGVGFEDVGGNVGGSGNVVVKQVDAVGAGPPVSVKEGQGARSKTAQGASRLFLCELRLATY